MSENDQGPGIKADMDQNIHDFHVIMGGLLWNSILELFLTADYPVTTPKIHFMDRIYHPNVDIVRNLLRYFGGEVAPSIRDQQSSVSHWYASANDGGVWEVVADKGSSVYWSIQGVD